MSGLVGTVNAQSAFEGFYGKIAARYANNIRKSTLTIFGKATNTMYSDPAAIANSALIFVGADYSFSILPQFLLGIGADYPTLTAKTASITSVSPGAQINEAFYKISNSYKIFVMPSYIMKGYLTHLKARY